MHREEIERFEKDGFEFVVYETPDNITPRFYDDEPGPEETEAVREEYRARVESFGDSWQYVGITVEARFILEDVENITLGSDSLWSIESDCREHIERDVIPELVAEALTEARNHLHKITQSLTRLEAS